MILLLAQEYELNVNRIAEILDHRRVPWVRLNGEDVPGLTRVGVRVGARRQDAWIDAPDGKTARLSDIRAVWARRNGEHRLDPRLRPGQQQFLARECSATLLGMYALLGHAAWMNDYFDEIKSINKLYQLAVAEECGLCVPETLVTQDPVEARRFVAALPAGVICKAISQSGHVPADEHGPGRVIFANRLADADVAALDAVRHAPTMLQAYVPKTIELRVTIVGQRVFATAIDSQMSERSRDDWRRYDTRNTPYYPYELPVGVVAALLRMMRRLNLVFGAVDLIRTRDGGFVFLEVNPGGQWGWVEGMTGHPIDEAVADWLCERSGREAVHARVA